MLQAPLLTCCCYRIHYNLTEFNWLIRYEESEVQPFRDEYRGRPETSAFDNYKQQSLRRFRQQEHDQYSSVGQPTRVDAFDQALLMQAPPPKPDRLFNTAE